MADIKTALVTGAARRVGRAIALNLAEHGWTVIVHFHRAEKDAEGAVAAIRAAGGAAFPVQGDLSMERETHRVFAESRAAAGPLTCLINNASVFELDTAASANHESWQRHIEPNLRAPLVLSQAFARALPEAQGGVIVNMLDQRVWNLTPYFLSYTVTKHAAVALAEWLAISHHHQGIRVSVLCPQAVRTNIIANSPDRVSGEAVDIDDFGVAAADGIVEADDVAQLCIEAMVEERFHILPHPEVGEYVKMKAADPDRWLSAMRKFQSRLHGDGQLPGDELLS